MLCAVCVGMLRDGKGQIADTFDWTFEHHKTTVTWRHSIENGCKICMSLAREPGSDVILRKSQSLSRRAILKILAPQPESHPGKTFRLEFDMGKNRWRCFLLTEIGAYRTDCVYAFTQTQPDARSQTRTANTKHQDPMHLAQTWLRQCNCADSWDAKAQKWYPRRLLDLRELLDAGSGSLDNARVYLIESDKHFYASPDLTKHIPHRNPSSAGFRYVTLSHCWGGLSPLRLTSQTERQFREDGIALSKLSKTFREAIICASQLDKVRYIWIDSLCIRQPIGSQDHDPKDEFSDWLEHSRDMGDIYQRAFINLSATAAENGDDGLFLDPRTTEIKDEEVMVHYPRDVNASFGKNSAPRQEDITRCALKDESAWDDLVDEAPVNKRGWVFQERLLASRVLHFSRGHVAWECSEFRHAEGFSDSELTTKFKEYSIVHEGQLKNLTVEAGRATRDARLQGYPDPDARMTDVYVYELWKRLVDNYTKTAITESDDRLIAFAGIASMFQGRMFNAATKNTYLAGLWTANLESQLVWHVNEVYEDGIYKNLGVRYPKRAPSFTWAAIDSPYGITYAEATDYGSLRQKKLFFSVFDCNIALLDPKNPFGMVTQGQLLLQPHFMRQISLRCEDNGRGALFTWSIKHKSGSAPIEHSNVILDAPMSDTDVFEKNAELYCMPAAIGPRTSRNEYLYCLLLKYEDDVSYTRRTAERSRKERFRGFRRIGLAKIGDLTRQDEEEKRRLMEKELREIICLY